MEFPIINLVKFTFCNQRHMKYPLKAKLHLYLRSQLQWIYDKIIVLAIITVAAIIKED